MSDNDTMHALGRIERALSRIEAIEAAGGDPAEATTLATLAARHDHLRARVQTTLGRLDALLSDHAEPQA